MNKIEKLEKLKGMFNKCGNGVNIMCMDDNGNSRWRIYRFGDLGYRVNWVKCKKILDKEGIKYDEGESGWGMRMSRCIDFNY
jgi:hypothetical protein